MKSINPLNLEENKTFDTLQSTQVTLILNNLSKKFPLWKKTKFEERAHLLLNLSQCLYKNSQKLAKLITTEMGKPITESIAEIEKCAWLCSYYADNGAQFLKSEWIDTDYRQSLKMYQPIGGVLGIMPWNYPFWQVFRFAVPTIMAGNIALLKHAYNVPQCAVAIEHLFLEAGFPKDVFTTLLIDHKEVQQVIAHPLVQAISLTGSNAAGASVSATASKYIKKSVLELGGSDAFIVCQDADINKAVAGAIKGRFQNSGQSCIAAKRFFIHKDIYDEFIPRFKQAIDALIVGNPLLPETNIGPLAKQKFVLAIDEQVKKSIKLGAQLITGGKPLGDCNQFYQPTLLTNCQVGMPVFDEEVFGPVAAVTSFQTLEEAISKANQTIYGLGASIWSVNREQAAQMAEQIDSGMVTINGIVSSDPRSPFGGVKASGFGRELGVEGIREFVNLKVININP